VKIWKWDEEPPPLGITGASGHGGHQLFGSEAPRNTIMVEWCEKWKKTMQNHAKPTNYG